MDGQMLQAIVSGGVGITLNISAQDLKEIISGIVHNERKSIDDAIERKRELPTMSRKQAKELLGISDPTLRAWELNGYLTPIRIGRKVMYRPADVEEILLSKKYK